MQRPTRPCPPDEVGTGAYGVPSWNWYGYSLPGVIDAGNITQGPTVGQTAAPLYNPYGTESELKGYRRQVRLARHGIRGLSDQLVSRAMPATQLVLQTAVMPAPTSIGPASGEVPPVNPITYPGVTTTPWYMQPYILIPAILIVGWFGWKKLKTQHAAAVPATAPAA